MENTNCDLHWLLSIELGLLVALVVVPCPLWALTLLVKQDSFFCWSTFLFKIGVLDEIDGSGGCDAGLGGFPKGGLSPITFPHDIYTHLSFEGKARPLPICLQ